MKSLIICFISGAIIGGALVYNFFIPDVKPPIKIVEKSDPVVKYKYKYVNVKNDIDTLRSCYKSVIKLSYDLPSVKGYDMHVKAWDDCKETSQVIKLEVARSGNWKFYVGAGVIAGAGSIYLAYKYLK